MKTILVIDDDRAFLELITEILKAADYLVLDANGAMDGIRIARDYPPDLVLCDIRMPVMNGQDVVRRLREFEFLRETPIVLMTGNADLPDMRAGMDAGADDYIAKPFGTADLLRIVQNHLERADQRRQRAETALQDLKHNLGVMLPRELLTPLHGIIGCASLLSMDADRLSRGDIKEFADNIQQLATELHRLTGNFLLYAKLETAHLSPHPDKDLRIDDVVTTVAHDVAERHKRGGDLVVQVTPATASVSHDHVVKVTDELLDNAFKFSTAGSPVSVRLQTDQNTVQLTIEDQGRGIAPEQLKQLGAYVQLDQRRQEQAGLGLGLAIAFRLAALIGGTVELTSKPGLAVGTRARLTLPASLAAA